MLEAVLEALFQQAGERDLVQGDVAMGVVLERHPQQVCQFARVQPLADALSDQRDTVSMAHGSTFQHSAFQNVANLVE